MRLSFVVCAALLLIAASQFQITPLYAQDNSVSLTAVTNDIANFRAGPELTYPILETLNLGETVQVDGRRGDNLWLRVVYNGQQGWVFYSLLNVQGDINSLPIIEAGPDGTTPSTSAATIDVSFNGAATTNAIANFRLGPSTAYSTIATLPANTPLTIIGRDAGGRRSSC